MDNLNRDPQSPEIPPPPPKLDGKQLWKSLLIPPIVMTLVLVIMLFSSGRVQGSVLNIGGLFVSISAIACWVLFANCISKRYIGPSRILLILTYPIIQAVLLFAIFFVGCLAIFSQTGLH